MPKKYSNDLKRSVVRHYRNNLSISEVSTVYDIPRKTVEKWLTKYRKEGDYAFDEYEYNQQKYIENLEKKVNIPIYLQDERMTTSIAQNILIEGNVRRKDRKKVVDQVAATIILQDYLDRKENNNE